jgi:peptide/nickel transport system ATP-binding protein
MSALLTVDNLRVSFPSRTGLIEAVRGVSFSLGRERLGIVGESGSGKSQTGRAIMGLTPPQARIAADGLQFGNTDLLAASPARRRSLRGKKMAMILQDPKYSLNPVMTVGRQIIETLRTHEKVPRPRRAVVPSPCSKPCRSAIRNEFLISIRTKYLAAWGSA